MIVCLIFEAVSFTLTTVWAAISALLMIFLSRTGLPLRWQFLIFFLITILLMIFTRPFAVKKLHLGRVPTNVNSLDGQEVLVVKKITKFEKGDSERHGLCGLSCRGQYACCKRKIKEA